MKKILSLIVSLAVVIGLFSGCGAKKDDKTIKVGASSTPHAEILESVKEDLAAKGYTLEVVIYDDYVLPNKALADGTLDANYFQHIPYLENFNEEQGTHLVNAGGIHYEPFGIYPGTKASLDDIADGDTIAVPNDTTNEARALLLLQDAGLIKLPEGTTLESTCTPLDVVENTKNLELVELNAELITGARSDVAYAVINGNYATLENLVPNADGLYVEGADSLAAQSYVNVVAVKPENAEADWVKALEQVIYTQKVYDLIVASGFAPTFTPADAQ